MHKLISGKVEIKKKDLLIHVFFPLLIGFIYYALFRSNSYIYVYIHSAFNIRVIDIEIPEVMNSYLCDFLWGYALYSLVCSITQDILYSCIIVVPFIVVIEFAQLENSRQVFDVMDIVVEEIAAVISLCILYSIRGEKK